MAEARSRGSWLRRNGLTVILLGAAAMVWFGGKELRRPHEPPPLDSSVPATAYADDGAAVEPLLGQATPAPRLVEFYTDECSACRTMRPTVERLRGEAMGGGYELLLINLSERRNEHLAARFQLRGVPTFALIGADGAETGRFEGVVGLRPLRRAASALVETR
ncbi:MAG: thioredoxin family protein [Myxococcota bacterium]|nr:thioredoxin family protein [Myxococcota bacterium]